MACIFCKSALHNYRNCPLRYLKQKPVRLKQDYYGKAPNVFIGRHGYPRIRVGILGTEKYEGHDDPQGWSAKQTPIASIVSLRSELVNSVFASNVKGTTSFTRTAKDASLAKRPVDVEVSLTRKPALRLSFSKDVLPYGPAVPLKRAEITENLPVDPKVEKAASATDLKAADAIAHLAKRGVDPYYLTKAFSMGNFGIPGERRLVPTRWSITAVDDIQSKEHLRSLRDCAISDCHAHFGGHYGNSYLLLFFDSVWHYELFEQYLPSARDAEPQSWADYEPYAGRKTYAKETAGGYYAARVALTEHLLRKKRQAGVLAIRIITDEYEVPLGVWVCREAVKKALASPAIGFADRHLMLEYARRLLAQKFSFDLDPVLKQSKLHDALFGQRRLSEY